MTTRSAKDRTAPELGGMTREQVVDELMNFPGTVRLDFTEEFVARQSLAELKHILAAARMHITIEPDEKHRRPTLAQAH